MNIEKDVEEYEELLKQLGYVKPVRCKDCYAFECGTGETVGVCKVWRDDSEPAGWCYLGEKHESD